MSDRTTRYFDKWWKDIDKACTDGLAELKSPALGDLVSVVPPASTDPVDHLDLRWTNMNSTPNVLTSAPLEATHAVFRLRVVSAKVDVDAFKGGAASKVADALALAARKAERQWVVRRILAGATPTTDTSMMDDLKSRDHAWRVVLLADVPGIEDACRDRGVDCVDARGSDVHSVANETLVGFGYPHVGLEYTRIEDFALSWESTSDGPILVLDADVTMRGSTTADPECWPRVFTH